MKFNEHDKITEELAGQLATKLKDSPEDTLILSPNLDRASLGRVIKLLKNHHTIKKLLFKTCGYDAWMDNLLSSEDFIDPVKPGADLLAYIIKNNNTLTTIETSGRGFTLEQIELVSKELINNFCLANFNFRIQPDSKADEKAVVQITNAEQRKLYKEIMFYSGTRKITKAINLALQEWLRFKKIAAIKKLCGKLAINNSLKTLKNVE